VCVFPLVEKSVSILLFLDELYSLRWRNIIVSCLGVFSSLFVILGRIKMFNSKNKRAAFFRLLSNFSILYIYYSCLLILELRYYWDFDTAVTKRAGYPYQHKRAKGKGTAWIVGDLISLQEVIFRS